MAARLARRLQITGKHRQLDAHPRHCRRRQTIVGTAPEPLVAVIIGILDLPGHHVELSIKPQKVNKLISFGFLISPPFAFLQIKSEMFE